MDRNKREAYVYEAMITLFYIIPQLDKELDNQVCNAYEKELKKWGFTPAIENFDYYNNGYLIRLTWEGDPPPEFGDQDYYRLERCFDIAMQKVLSPFPSRRSSYMHYPRER